MGKKRSQIGMTETIAILFIFFILVALGFMFYLRISRTSIKTQYEKGTDLMAIEITQKASFLPEIQCSKKNVITDNCIDILKLESATQIINENNITYYDLFFSSEIVVEELYPDEKTWVLYNHTIEDASALFTPVPILLYNATADENYFGVLQIKYFAIK